MELNYQDIGIRIKKFRLAKHMTQDKLAEQANLSNPHMSHIESGSTKVSLPTLIRLASVLHCSVDELLCDNLSKAHEIFENEVMEETKDCSEEEIRIIADTVKALKQSLRKRKRQGGSWE